MEAWLQSWLDVSVLCLVLLAALAFKPWLPLRHKPLQSPWLGVLALLPFVWWTEHLLPSGLALHLAGSCLLVLMFGWPLAMWTLLPIAAIAAYLQHPIWPDPQALISHTVWMGMIPGTLALLLGLLIRRLLPHHLFVYILGRGFISTAVAISLTGFLAYLMQHKPDSIALEEWLLAHWLLGWGEAISTGMITAIFVAFKPQWLLTYSDERYLPPPQPR
jgi:uncharacterized membrane protein